MYKLFNNCLIYDFHSKIDGIEFSLIDKLDFIYYSHNAGDDWHIKKEFGEECQLTQIPHRTKYDMKKFMKNNDVRWIQNSLFIDDFLYQFSDFSRPFFELNLFGVIHRKNNNITIINDKYSRVPTRGKILNIDSFKNDYIDVLQRELE